jgi:cap2 methyltransferase
MKTYRIGTHDKKIVFLDNEKYHSTLYKNKDDLIKTKCKIDGYDQKKWDKCKKYLNEHEYIYTSSNTQKNICGIIPVSRSYFKLHELIYDLNLINLKENNTFVCIAEGPGGFIHCLHDYCYNENISFNNIHGITLISDNSTIPYWNNSIIRNKKNNLCFGKDETGDIYKLENVDLFIDEIQKDKGKCSLLTADGGFDYSDDYNSQEDSSYKLLFSEIYIALNTQDLKGNFVIKVFDLFNYQTIQLIYLLYCCYSIVEIYKPTTSRLSNSEKYIVCSDFNGVSTEILEILKNNFNEPEKFSIDIPDSFINDINKYNTLFVPLQIETINNILRNINNYKETPTKDQILSAKKWCELYKLPINRKCMYL